MRIKILCADQLFRHIDVPDGCTVEAAVRQAGFEVGRFCYQIDGVAVQGGDVLPGDGTVVTLWPLGAASEVEHAPQGGMSVE